VTAGLAERAVADDLGDVGPAVRWVADGVSDADLSEDLRYALEVCLEEALSNLILHGVCGGRAKDIAIGYQAGNGEAMVLISDGCEPFDLTAAAPATPTPDHVGGRGIGLMRAFASALGYASEGGRNTLTLYFRPDQGSSRPSLSASGSNP
jgi:anti-sigma regulatory factor (Ser/Thr protein kinase)